jgi:ubiquinone/menaquinone biosynthesis C-methylase UbiE
VGVGEGLLAESMVSWGDTLRMIGLDMSHAHLKEAIKKLRGSRSFFAVCARGDLPPFKGGAFSRVVCINTLPNQPSWEEAAAVIQAMCVLVDRGGGLLFDLRNGRDPLICWADRFSTVSDPSTKRLPVRAYSFTRVEELLKSSGFRVKRKVAVCYPFWPIPSAYVIEAAR